MRKRNNSLDEALSFVPPPATYPPGANISTGVTLGSGVWSPTRVKRWCEFLKRCGEFRLQRGREI
ncbi:serine/threonine-protein kinase brsk2-like isoform x3 [Gigaspora margarita]|uniref:Serine/threonine-protein kinase brsk2-like isoform x3 n=1 Tax=Gigaspora margarita TaxID=4874 RepID=A0A8H4EIU0_GIGMA|nr:serine/threonine-protein kinase brsk2-like isoform x3 [Gigaspora margarita]